jgi:hypothetical protein
MTSTPSEATPETPPGVTIVKLPILGRTWYERGFWYWCRRVGAALLLAVMVAVYAAIITGVLNLFGRPGSAGFDAALAVEIVFSLVTGVFAFRHLWQLGVSGRSLRGRTGGGAGAGAGLVAFWAGGIGAVFLVASAVLSAGFALAAFAIWLAPVPPTERYARRVLAEDRRLQHRRHVEPARSSKHGRRPR